jgi:hypothetical protein
LHLPVLDTPLAPPNLSRLEHRSAYRIGHIRPPASARGIPAIGWLSVGARLPATATTGAGPRSSALPHRRDVSWSRPSASAARILTSDRRRRLRADGRGIGGAALEAGLGRSSSRSAGSRPRHPIQGGRALLRSRRPRCTAPMRLPARRFPDPAARQSTRPARPARSPPPVIPRYRDRLPTRRARYQPGRHPRAQSPRPIPPTQTTRRCGDSQPAA